LIRAAVLGSLNVHDGLRGPIPFDTALRFAAEIAHALDASTVAHRPSDSAGQRR
jgi:hypothetical protein